MAASLRQHDPASVLWVLSLDSFTSDFLREINDDKIKVIDLATVEVADPSLAAAKSNRNAIEYYFTLSPCWPRYLLNSRPEIERITYLDADMFFFSTPTSIYTEMGDASVLVTEHRYPSHLCHHERCGRFNVGLLSFRNDDAGRGCLDDWRERCLEWCYDRTEEGKYADQKYLDHWPAQLGERLHVSTRRGVNLAPWNWSQYHYTFKNGGVHVDGDPLALFHFARFRPSFGTHWFQSGQLEYNVMPWRLRQSIYGPYWRALEKAFAEIHRRRPTFRFNRANARSWHCFWRTLIPRLIFGSDWLRIGPVFVSGRFGLGRFSGLVLSHLRRWLNGPTPVNPASVANDPPVFATPADRE
jgi:hypothetical protein